MSAVVHRLLPKSSAAAPISVATAEATTPTDATSAALAVGSQTYNVAVAEAGSAQSLTNASSPAPINDTWTLLGKSTNDLPQVVSAFFERPCIAPTGDIWVIWDGPADASKSGVYVFRHATNKWQNFNEAQVFGSTSDPTWPRDSNTPTRASYRWENDMADWDEVTQSLWWGTPGPTIFADSRDVRLDPATMTFHSFAGGVGDLDRMGGVWNGNAYDFGFTNGQYNQIRTRTLPSGGVTTYSDTNIPPFLDNDHAYSGNDMGTTRGGIDHRTGHAWCFTNGGELYMRSLVLGAADPIQWFHLPTVGTKPTRGAVYTLHEGLDCIVAYTGNTTGNNESSPGPGPDPSTTYVLDLATLVWRLGPSLPAFVPPAVAQANCALLYDRFNHEIKYVQSFDLVVYRLDLGASQL